MVLVVMLRRQSLLCLFRERCKGGNVSKRLLQQQLSLRCSNYCK